MGFVHKTHDDSTLDLLNGSPPKMLISWDFMGLVPFPGVILMLALDSKAINLDVLGYGPPIAMMVIYIYNYI